VDNTWHGSKPAVWGAGFLGIRPLPEQGEKYWNIRPATQMNLMASYLRGAGLGPTDKGGAIFPDAGTPFSDGDPKKKALSIPSHRLERGSAIRKTSWIKWVFSDANEGSIPFARSKILNTSNLHPRE
jgi:hypothetical protein